MFKLGAAHFIWHFHRGQLLFGFAYRADFRDGVNAGRDIFNQMCGGFTCALFALSEPSAVVHAVRPLRPVCDNWKELCADNRLQHVTKQLKAGTEEEMLLQSHDYVVQHGAFL